MKSFLSALSLILSTNATISSSHLVSIRSSIAFSVLPHFSYNSLSFQNFYFENRFKLDHFQPILFQNCYFSSQIDLNSNAPLYLENCHNITGTIISSAKIILVFNSSFNQNFTEFNIQDCKNCSFINTNFSTKSNKHVISLRNSQSRFISCNFSNCLHGGIISFDSNLFVINSTFNHIKSTKGAAIFFLGKRLFIDNCKFIQCQSTIEGGAIFFVASISTIQKTHFIENYSPRGKSISCYYKDLDPTLIDCFFTDIIEKEIVKRNFFKYSKNNNISKYLLEETVPIPPPPPPTRSPLPPATQSPTASQSPSPSSSPSMSPTASASPSVSQSPTASQSPVATPSPIATPTIMERKVINKKKFYITFVSVVCAVFVIIVIIVVVVVLVKRKRNRVYPKTDSDEAEPEGVAVIVNRIYDDNTKSVHADEP